MKELMAIAAMAKRLSKPTFVKIGPDRVSVDELTNYWQVTGKPEQFGFLLRGNSTQQFISLPSEQAVRETIAFLDNLTKPKRVVFSKPVSKKGRRHAGS